MTMNEDELRRWLADHEIDEVEAIVPDMAGVARGKYMPAGQFAEAIEHLARFTVLFFLLRLGGRFGLVAIFAIAQLHLIQLPLRPVPTAAAPSPRLRLGHFVFGVPQMKQRLGGRLLGRQRRVQRFDL